MDLLESTWQMEGIRGLGPGWSCLGGKANKVHSPTWCPRYVCDLSVRGGVLCFGFYFDQTNSHSPRPVHTPAGLFPAGLWPAAPARACVLRL